MEIIKGIIADIDFYNSQNAIFLYENPIKSPFLK
jgi:hypothetical protein